jgi:hypothetical protein
MSRPFHEILPEMRGGRYAIALTEALEEVVMAVRDNGGKGAVSMVLTVEQKSDDGALELSMKVVTKTPRPSLGAAVMFADDAGALSLFDSKQPDMFGANPVRVVASRSRDDDVPVADRAPATRI